MTTTGTARTAVAGTMETVEVTPDATLSNQQDITGLGAQIDVSGVELIAFEGVDSADRLIVDNGGGDLIEIETGSGGIRIR